MRDIVPKRALDIGCAVGRSTFELASGFLDVVGIDYSHGFIKTCDVLKQNGKMEYEITTEGVLTSRHEAVISANIVSHIGMFSGQLQIIALLT
ncbi:unnamed protein product [Clavelina lepadiformis]|uniref:Methyltransferase type 11 domain-containing protein n=1 Tax=Clavelina lepadiformis TaxID=159417 RepID=A0ABP0FLI0_CLALP